MTQPEFTITIQNRDESYSPSQLKIIRGLSSEASNIPAFKFKAYLEKIGSYDICGLGYFEVKSYCETLDKNSIQYKVV